jgi:glycosyltransferase involved in cell wall biosynthesis
MARVAFFTERIDDSIGSFAFELMTGLADQQHDLRVYSTYRESDIVPETHARLQLIRPFKKWNWLELGFLVPLLMEQQPEILHFIQPHDQALRGFTNAMAVIPLMSPLMQKPSVVLSLYDFKERDLEKFKTLVFTADTITVTNPSQARAVEQWLMRLARANTKRANVVVVPLPSQTAKLDSEEPLPANVESFIKSKKLLLVPGDVSDHENIEGVFSFLKETLQALPDARVLFIGGWGDVKAIQRRDILRNFDEPSLGSRILFTGPLSATSQHACLTKARVVLAASLALESVALARWTRSSLQARVPLILSEKQLELDPLPWRDRENSFVVTGEPASWGSTVSEALLNDETVKSIRAGLREFARLETFDVPSNAISRIYAQLATKRNR